MNKTSRRREELGRKLKKYQIGGVIRLDMDVAKRCAWIAFAYEVDETELLFFCFKSIDNGEERVKVVRLVMHHYRTKTYNESE